MLSAISASSPLILASSSKYRAELLARLRVPFEGMATDVDESALPGESAEALSRRLAAAKAQALAGKFPGRWVLGSDQAAECEGRIFGKPGGHERALQQLLLASGKSLCFHTAVALAGNGRLETAADVTTVRFRTLGREALERYLAQEPAYDCAGSFKCEGLGITLFESIEAQDPTALIGLPLIAVSRLLTLAGYSLP